MDINDAIARLKNCHPITEEDKETFECAVHCMEFTKDFLPLGASPDRMQHALNLMNSLEYVFKNANKCTVDAKNMKLTF